MIGKEKSRCQEGVAILPRDLSGSLIYKTFKADVLTEALRHPLAQQTF